MWCVVTNMQLDTSGSPVHHARAYDDGQVITLAQGAPIFDSPFLVQGQKHE